ncbi:MAG: hypothetical protein KJ904_16365 [Alphaproteobacteria bacterium]|nr:hypothetical protein [Alphaproteobacteria bacterium]MBU0798880.1 hypothetical protein [Alphaproteobacteria bacterium]MBU0888730.1 hypothetical protein [Alphaproteobacteria bacterium]MBU1813536.1 hypothetical protein [Alphaproteobacteria bacterium]
MAQISPWSVKGVPYEDREAAKLLARQAGLPLGAWLSQLIRRMSEGTGDSSAALPEPFLDQDMPEALEPAAVAPEAAEELERRLAALQAQIDALNAVLRDLPVSGAQPEGSAPIERAVMRLSERVQRLEQTVFEEEDAQGGVMSRFFGRR